MEHNKDAVVVDEVIASRSDKYGKVGEMTVRRGKTHDYLEMTLDFSEEGKLILNMEKSIDEILIELPEDMHGVATTPAADILSKIQNDKPKLNKERAELFHRITTQILFLAQCVRPDLWTTI